MKLICYRTQRICPPIRPATPERTWMDRSTNGFAYRCLPLDIANAHGWEILSPFGFRARWNGQANERAVEVLVGQADPTFVSSHFGGGC